MGAESDPVERKNPVSEQEAKRTLLEYLTWVELVKIDDYFKVFDVPQSVVDDLEIQKKVDDFIQTFSDEVRQGGTYASFAEEAIDLLKRLFKS
ncbi:hypothetical protein HYW82_03520 [Candidatus Peregrinibacteria bacterium]|nr:hypothetical protein [Candidatus Peregrinibacteria bacterium]